MGRWLQMLPKQGLRGILDALHKVGAVRHVESRTSMRQQSDYPPMDGLRAVDEGFREHVADSLRKEGKQLPGTVKDDTDAKGNEPSFRRPAGRPQRVL